MKQTITSVKPFLKWAGGKTQLLEEITKRLPIEFRKGKIKRYIEPFIGGGALFLKVAQSYKVEKYYISDINEDLVLAYKCVKRDVNGLIALLRTTESTYHSLDDEERENYFYEMRTLYNKNRLIMDYTNFTTAWIERTVQIIFLNKTCFNGLFRVNSKGEFNVPFGRYKNPLICDETNLTNISKILQNTDIRVGDFAACKNFVGEDSFVYFDPPYRPLSKTANFTSYTNTDFNDTAQVKLATFYRLLDKTGAKLLLSNSDPKNEDSKDNFFEDYYKEFIIQRVKANRMINCNSEKRGPINELLIMNYEAPLS